LGGPLPDPEKGGCLRGVSSPADCQPENYAQLNLGRKKPAYPFDFPNSVGHIPHIPHSRHVRNWKQRSSTMNRIAGFVMLAAALVVASVGCGGGGGGQRVRRFDDRRGGKFPDQDRGRRGMGVEPRDRGIGAGPLEQPGWGVRSYGGQRRQCRRLYVAKTDAGGMILWERYFGGTGDDIGRSVRRTSDGGYILAGSTTSAGSGGVDAYLVKTDGVGAPQW